MRLIVIPAVVAALSISSAEARAQAKPDKQQPNPAYAKPGQQKPYGGQQYGKGQVNPWNAAHATKEMLMRHGYKVVGVEQLEDGNVLYYRRGDAVRVSDISVEKAVIRKNGETVEIEGVPRAVLADVKAKLGM